MNEHDSTYNQEGPGDCGEVAERLMAPVLKTGIPERVSGVRIPPSPPLQKTKDLRSRLYARLYFPRNPCFPSIEHTRENRKWPIESSPCF